MAIPNTKGQKPLSEEEKAKLAGEGRKEEEAIARYVISNGKPKKT